MVNRWHHAKKMVAIWICILPREATLMHLQDDSRLFHNVNKNYYNYNVQFISQRERVLLLRNEFIVFSIWNLYINNFVYNSLPPFIPLNNFALVLISWVICENNPTLDHFLCRNTYSIYLRSLSPENYAKLISNPCHPQSDTDFAIDQRRVVGMLLVMIIIIFIN